MDQKLEKQKPTELEIVNGGAPIMVKFKGTLANPEPVLKEMFCKIISPRNMESLGFAWMREEKEIPIYLGVKPEEAESFVESIHPDGLESIMTEGRRLNFTAYHGWYNRRVQAIDAQADQLTRHREMVNNLLASEEGRKDLQSRIDALSLTPKSLSS